VCVSRDGIFTVGRNNMCCVGLTKQHSANSTKGLNLTDQQNHVGLKMNKRGRKIMKNDKYEIFLRIYFVVQSFSERCKQFREHRMIEVRCRTLFAETAVDNNEDTLILTYKVTVT